MGPVSWGGRSAVALGPSDLAWSGRLRMKVASRAGGQSSLGSPALWVFVSPSALRLVTPRRSRHTHTLSQERHCRPRGVTPAGGEYLLEERWEKIEAGGTGERSVVGLLGGRKERWRYGVFGLGAWSRKTGDVLFRLHGA